MILIPRPRMEGYYRLDAVRPSGIIRASTGWFPNLITNAGLDWLGATNSGTVNATDYCHVGTGTAEPSVLDTALQEFVASKKSAVGDITTATQSTPPYYGRRTSLYRFEAGTATGNISEVGVGPLANTTTQKLFSRALVIDGNGDPTTITVKPNEELRVTYELRLYPPLDDVLSTTTIDGQAYDVVVRAGTVTNNNNWADQIGQRINYSPGGNAWGFTGDIGPITGSPAGGSVGSNLASTWSAYSAGSYVRRATWAWPTSSAGNIKSVRLSTAYGEYQIGFTPAIPKLNTQTLTMAFDLAWARKILDAP